MEREAEMLDETLFLLFHRPVETVVLSVNIDVAIFDGMQKIHVEITSTRSFQLFIENAVAVFLAMDLPGR